MSRLREKGHEVLAASPKTGVNSVTGEGLAAALEGARVVIDVANSLSFEGHDPLWSSAIIENRNASNGPRIHGCPDPLQWLGEMAIDDGAGHESASVGLDGIGSRAGDYFDNVRPRYRANRDAVSVAHDRERCVRAH